MNIICKPRGCGKTYDLIMESARTGHPIVTLISDEARFIDEGANVETVTYTPDNMKENNKVDRSVNEIEKVCEKFKSKYANEIVDVNIIVPDKVVEVTFLDGIKEKAVCREPDTFSLEQAIGICISKKVMGGSSAYNNAIKRGIKIYENKIREEQMDKEEKERIERKRAKKKAYKERRAAKRVQAEREKQIEIQKEAYIRAMMEIDKMKNKGV